PEPSHPTFVVSARVAFGAGPLGMQQSHTVLLQNHKSSGVRVSAPAGTLDPFSVDLPSGGEEEVLPPGGEIPVRFSFQPEVAGVADVVAPLRTEAGDLRFHLTGEGVKTPIVCEPSGVLAFGAVVGGLKKVQSISCRNEGPVADRLQVQPILDSEDFDYD